MLKRLSIFVGLGVTLAAFPAASADVDEESTLRSWAAPPYWLPAPTDPGDGPRQRSAREATREALVAAPAALPFVALPPCRLVDTRGNAPLTGGFLPAATVRSYAFTGVCGVPANAQAISLNATAVRPTGPGFLVLYAQGAPFPPVSTLNFVGNDVVANAAVVALGAGGAINVVLGVSGGDVILDTNGYYAPAGVSSINALSGDVTLSPGANVSLAQAGNTLTISSSGTPSGPAGGSLTGTYPNPGIAASAIGTNQLAAGAVTDAKVANGISYGKLTGVPDFVHRSGDTMTGTLNLNPGHLNLTSSSPASGNILKNGFPFLHDYGVSNLFVGINAGNFSLAGCCNLGLGEGALSGIAGGGSNVAVGQAALTGNLDGTGNVAVGVQALVSNTSGWNNVAVGNGALLSHTGYESTAVGSQALQANTSTGNTAVGFQALGSNATGASNSALGHLALNRSTGDFNTGLGTAVGNISGFAPGYGGGTVPVTPLLAGAGNTLVGSWIGVTSATVNNCTALGYFSYCDADNQVRLGNGFTTSIGGKVGWSALSDARAKQDVRDVSLGLNFVLSLRPVEYRLRRGDGRVDMGFVAQDVEALLGETYGVVDVGGDADRTLSLRYSDLIAPLVKAVQQQEEIIRKLEARLKLLEAVISRVP